ncbi:unnamed protein product [Nezara viridula]|uniref:C2H2-type domain-containing protein n=1 Tax=Nezara viridula TaxID=85310 RepID=A0A9P0HTK5_NEZVI|nr:unnamed protein product [Nezara viridula]
MKVHPVSDMNDYLINYASLQLANTFPANTFPISALDYCNCPCFSDKAVQVNLVNEEYIRCDVCKVDCNGNAAYKSHLSGSKHSKKLKEQEMTQYLKLPYIRHNEDSNTFSCTLCCATLNAVSQIAAHIEGQKHKNKAQSHEPIAASNTQINSTRDPAKPHLFYPIIIHDVINR